MHFKENLWRTHECQALCLAWEVQASKASLEDTHSPRDLHEFPIIFTLEILPAPPPPAPKSCYKIMRNKVARSFRPC